MATIFAIGTRGLQLVEDEFSSEKVAELIDSRARPGSMVIAQGDPNEKTTLFFYVRRPIYWVDGHPNIEFATRILEIGLDHYLTRQQVAQRWRETNQVFLVIESSALAEWKTYLSLDARPVDPDWSLWFPRDFGESVKKDSGDRSQELQELQEFRSQELQESESGVRIKDGFASRGIYLGFHEANSQTHAFCNS